MSNDQTLMRPRPSVTLLLMLLLAVFAVARAEAAGMLSGGPCCPMQGYRMPAHGMPGAGMGALQCGDRGPAYGLTQCSCLPTVAAVRASAPESRHILPAGVPAALWPVPRDTLLAAHPPVGPPRAAVGGSAARQTYLDTRRLRL